MSGVYGVDQVKAGLDLVFAGISAVKLAKDDGKVDLADVQFLLPVILHVGPALKDLSMYPKEVGEMDSKDAAELMLHAGSRLPGLVGEELAVKVNAALKVLVAVAELISALKSQEVVL